MQNIEDVKLAHEMELMAIPGVEGVGIGADEIGNPALTVYINDASVADRLPRHVDGFPVIVENLRGPIDALPEHGR